MGDRRLVSRSKWRCPDCGRLPQRCKMYHSKCRWTETIDTWSSLKRRPTSQIKRLRHALAEASRTSNSTHPMFITFFVLHMRCAITEAARRSFFKLRIGSNCGVTLRFHASRLFPLLMAQSNQADLYHTAVHGSSLRRRVCRIIFFDCSQAFRNSSV